MKFYFRHLCWTICTKSKSWNRMKRAQRINRAHRLLKELWINCHQDAVKQHSGTLGNVDSFKPRTVIFTVIKYVKTKKKQKKKNDSIFSILLNFFFILDESRTVNQKSPILFSNWLAAKLK